MAFHNSPFHATIVNKRYSKLTRIEGTGQFTFKNGAIYKGSFKDGQFHGQGTIFYTNGSKLEANWEYGKASNEGFTFGDGLVYDQQNWEYCTEKDRRFYTEQTNGFQPGEPQLSDRKPRIGVIPLNDHVYFNQEDGKVYDYDGCQLRDATIDEKVFVGKQTFVASSLQVYQ
jgi:hypothetical protein